MVFFIISIAFFCLFVLMNDVASRLFSLLPPPFFLLLQIDLRRLPPREHQRLKSETELLKVLTHNHIIRFQAVWENKRDSQVCFTTELMTSGTLKQYIDRVFVKGLKLKIVKKWCRQILSGLEYLHSGFEPPVIHRDIKCDNIFINGNDPFGFTCIIHFVLHALYILFSR